MALPRDGPFPTSCQENGPERVGFWDSRKMSLKAALIFIDFPDASPEDVFTLSCKGRKSYIGLQDGVIYSDRK